MEFEELAEARAEIKKFVGSQQDSIAQFWDPEGNNYRITKDAPRKADPDREVDGLTSTYTCLESLIEAGAAAPRESIEEAVSRLRSFGELSIEASPFDWKSDNSGWVYCRVRSLGTIARHRPKLLAKTEIAELLEPVWLEAIDPDGGAYGVRELSRRPLKERSEPRDTKYEPPAIDERVYTPNAYLSYWALFVGDSLPDGDAREAYKPHRKAIKKSLFSVVPYLIGFGALPAIATLSRAVPAAPALWSLGVGALLGAAAHFANTLPDLEGDAATGVRGLPHFLGRRWSSALTYLVLLAASVLEFFGTGGLGFLPGELGLGAAIVIAIVGWAMIARPTRWHFRLIIMAAMIDVVVLIFAGSRILA